MDFWRFHKGPATAEVYRRNFRELERWSTWLISALFRAGISQWSSWLAGWQSRHLSQVVRQLGEKPSRSQSENSLPFTLIESSKRLPRWTFMDPKVQEVIYEMTRETKMKIMKQSTRHRKRNELEKVFLLRVLGHGDGDALPSYDLKRSET